MTAKARLFYDSYSKYENQLAKIKRKFDYKNLSIRFFLILLYIVRELSVIKNNESKMLNNGLLIFSIKMNN